MVYRSLDMNSSRPLLYQAIDIRRAENKDTVIIIVGEKRTGKSYSAMKIAEGINPRFDADKDVFYDTKPFLMWLREAKDSVCVLDEVSVSYSNRDWWDVQNKIFNQILTTQGFRRNVFIMTLPALSHLDKQAIDLSHYLLVMLRIGFLKCYRIMPRNLKAGYYPIGFEFLRMGLPTKNNIEKYETMKVAWNDKKLQDNIDYIAALEDKENYIKQFNYREYIKAFGLGLMAREEAKKKMIRMGYNEKDIAVMLDTEQKRIDEKRDRRSKRDDII